MQTVRAMVAKCRSRWGVVLLLLYQFLFLNIVVPGHTRGVITLDAKHTTERLRPCCSDDFSNRPPSGTDPKHAPSQRDKDNCAICNFAARVMPAPVLHLNLPEPTLLAILPVPLPAILVSADPFLTYFGRGPPA